MGKDLKGKDLGTGLRQLKNGQYNARFTTKEGKRLEKSFRKVQEAKNWLKKAKEDDDSKGMFSGELISVNQWYSQWINVFMRRKVRESTIYNYGLCFNRNISTVIGDMKLSDVKPYHCQLIVNTMLDRGLAVRTVRFALNILKCMFLCATENGLIQKSPVVTTISIPREILKQQDCLTIDQVKEFLVAIQHNCVYDLQFRLVLETGMRYSELAALTVDSIDFDNNLIHINGGLHYTKERHSYLGDVKTESSVRDIPMTGEARQILKEAIERKQRRKVEKPEWKDLLFVGRNGGPICNTAYDKALKNIAQKRMNIKPFSMHDLRRTFSTLCYNAGCREKDMAMIMGHSSANTTMKYYVKADLQNALSVIEKVSEMKNIG